MDNRQVIARIRGSAAVALECLKSAHTQGDARRYIQQVLDGIDVAMSLVEFDGGRAVTDGQVKHMVDRFLGWRLPENFNPDGGISFKKFGNEGTAHQYRNEPSGTNVLDADQASAMVKYMLEGLPVSEPQ